MNYPTYDFPIQYGHSEGSFMDSTNTKSNLPLNLSRGKAEPYMDVLLAECERETTKGRSNPSPVYQFHQIHQFKNLHFSHQHESTLYPNLQDTSFGKFPADSPGGIRSDSCPYGNYVRNNEYLCSSQQTSATKQFHLPTTPHHPIARHCRRTATQQIPTTSQQCYQAEPQQCHQIPSQHHHQSAASFLRQHQNETSRHPCSVQGHQYQSSKENNRLVSLQQHEPEIQEDFTEDPLTEEILHPFITNQLDTRNSTLASGYREWVDCVDYDNQLLCSHPEASSIGTHSSVQHERKSASDVFKKNTALIKNRFPHLKKKQDSELISRKENLQTPIRDVFQKNSDIMTLDEDENFSSSSSSATDALSTDQSSGSAGSVGLRDLLLLPSSYKELSVFQKKYFPTNDYAENNYLNTVLNIHSKSKPTTTKSELENGVEKEQKDSTGKLTSAQDTVLRDQVSAVCEPSNQIFTKNDSLCEVCGEKAAGFYCGAFVCEACKKFFMRAVKLKSVKFTCLRDKKCTITKENRVRCQYCRYMKCLKLNMFSPGSNPEVEKETEISQLPCQVCGAASSGFHFGALTCEGCKGFFRRMTKERNPCGYQCLKDRKCLVTMATRNVCKACRYKKCVDCGMSVSSSRIGRKPNVVKHALALARKTSSLQKIQNKVLDDVAITTSSSTLLPPDLCSSSSSSPSSSSSSSSPSSSPSLSSQSTSNVTPAKSSIDRKKSEVFRKILESDCYDVIEHIKKAATELDGILDQSYREREDEADDYVDHKAVWNKLMKRFEIHIKSIIKFSKKVPGFSLLDIKTQMLMIQLSVYTIILLKMSEKYQPDNPIVLDFSIRESIQVHKYFPIIDLVETHLKHVGTMRNSLSLDKTETCIMAVLLLLDEESVSDEEKDTVSDIQEKIIECLKVYEEDNYNSGSVRYGVILLRLGEFSLASLQYGQALSGITAMYPDLDMPQFLNDIILK